MTIKIYVDWDENDIINEAEYEKIIEEDAKEMASDNYELNEWLNENYQASDIFNWSDAERKKAKKLWEEYCISCSRDGCRFEERTIEV